MENARNWKTAPTFRPGFAARRAGATDSMVLRQAFSPAQGRSTAEASAVSMSQHPVEADRPQAG